MITKTTKKTIEKKNKSTKITAKIIKETPEAYLLKIRVSYGKAGTEILTWFSKSETKFLGRKTVIVDERCNYACDAQIFEIEDWVLWNIRKEIADFLGGIPEKVKFQSIHKKKNTYTLV